MQQTGSILKKAREEAGLSLQEVSLSLKISSRIIQAIEEADEKKLPAKTFLRGFVKSYANLLKLDEAHILEVFYTEVGTTVPKLNVAEGATRRGETVDVSRPKPELKEPIRAKTTEAVPTDSMPSPSSETTTPAGATGSDAAPAAAEKSFAPHKQNIVEPSLKPIDQNKSPKTAILTVVAVILVILIIGAQQIINKYSKEASIPTDPSAIVNEDPSADESAPLSTDATTGAAATEAPMTPAAGETSTAATESTSNTTAPQDSTISPAPIAEATKPILPVPTTLQKEDAKKEVPATPAVNEPKAGFPKVVVPAGKPIELIVEAMDSVEIEYSSKNGKKSSIKLTPEQVHTFKSKDGLNVRISNGGAVNLILNGRDLGIPGDSGKSINLSY